MNEPLTNEEGEVRELTQADFKRFRPIAEADPDMLVAVEKYRKRGRPPAERPKMRVGLRLAPDVVEGLRASGPGYNARVEKVLREALAKGQL